MMHVRMCSEIIIMSRPCTKLDQQKEDWYTYHELVFCSIVIELYSTCTAGGQCSNSKSAGSRQEAHMRVSQVELIYKTCGDTQPVAYREQGGYKS